MAQAILTSLSTQADSAFGDDQQVYTTAAARVCDVTELLEHILSYLPARDIFLAQIVSNHFKATISNSQRLQRALFTKSELANSSQHIRFNPILRSMPIFTYCNLQVPLSGPGIPYGYSEPLNHITSEPSRFRLKDNYFASEAWKWPHQATAPSPPKTGSWRNMYLTQPPCEMVVRVWKDDGVYALPKRTYTMGELATVLQREGLGTRTRLEVAVEEPVSEFCVQLDLAVEESVEGSLVYDPYGRILDSPLESSAGVTKAAEQDLPTESSWVPWIEDMREYEFEGSGSEVGESGSWSDEDGSDVGDDGSESDESEGGDGEGSESGGSESGSNESEEGDESEDYNESGSEPGRIVSCYSYPWSRDDERGSDDGQSESAGFERHIEDDAGSESGDENEVCMARRRVIYGYYY